MSHHPLGKTCTCHSSLYLVAVARAGLSAAISASAVVYRVRAMALAASDLSTSSAWEPALRHTSYAFSILWGKISCWQAIRTTQFQPPIRFAYRTAHIDPPAASWRYD